jgi:hypothetical protein
LYIDNQVSTFCVLSPLNLSIFKFDAVCTIPDSQKANFDNLITLFKKRFKDKQHLLDLTILQTHQGRNEYVLDYLSQLSTISAINGNFFQKSEFASLAFFAKVAQCLNSSTFVGSFVITMVFNSGFNPCMANTVTFAVSLF